MKNRWLITQLNKEAMQNKYLMACFLEDKLIVKIRQLANYRNIRESTLVETIVKQFEEEWEDIRFLRYGPPEKTWTDKFNDLFKLPEVRSSINFQVNKETFERVSRIKEKYGLNKSIVLKHIISKYLRDYD